MVTPPDASFDLHLPAGTATLFQQRVALIPEGKRNAWRFIASSPTTRLSRSRAPIAFGGELAAANQLERAGALQGWRVSWVPLAPQRRPQRAYRCYTARRGIPWSPLRIGSRLAESVAPLEQNRRRQGGGWPSPARGRTCECAGYRSAHSSARISGAKAREAAQSRMKRPRRDLHASTRASTSGEEKAARRVRRTLMRRRPLEEKLASEETKVDGDLITYLSIAIIWCNLEVQLRFASGLHVSAARRCKRRNNCQRQAAGGNRMEEVFGMYAMSDGNHDGEPAEAGPRSRRGLRRR